MLGRWTPAQGVLVASVEPLQTHVLGRRLSPLLLRLRRNGEISDCATREPTFLALFFLHQP